MKRGFKQYFILIFLLLINTNICFGTKNQITNDSLSKCIIENAKYFLGTAYVANTLDQNETEQLVCTNDHFDCVTFVEYILAMTLYHNQQQEKVITFEEFLISLRYRNGEIDGYGSRLHYFSEWIAQQEKKKLLANISQQLGGKKFEGPINFMSINKSKYPKLKSNQDIAKVAETEMNLNKNSFYYIPKGMIKDKLKLLKDGDIIGITTYIKGLDFVHTGFIILQSGTPHIIHASETFGKVVISEQSIDKYLLSHKKQSGIVVCRLN